MSGDSAPGVTLRSAVRAPSSSSRSSPCGAGGRVRASRANWFRYLMAVAGGVDSESAAESFSPATVGPSVPPAEDTRSLLSPAMASPGLHPPAPLTPLAATLARSRAVTLLSSQRAAGRRQLLPPAAAPHRVHPSSLRVDMQAAPCCGRGRALQEGSEGSALPAPPAGRRPPFSPPFSPLPSASEPPCDARRSGQSY